MKNMTQKYRKRILAAFLSAAMLVSLYIPFASAEEPNYILNISDAKYFNHTNNTTTQQGSANLYYYGGEGSSITCEDWEKDTDKPIKVKQEKMSDWKGTFWTEAKAFSTAQNTVVDIEFKVYLDDYAQPSPYIGLRLYTSNNLVNCDGMEWRGIQLKESEKDTLHHMRYVLSKEDGKAVVKYSLDGADYKTKTGGAVAETAVNWGYVAENDETAQLRFMPTSIPSGGRDEHNTDDGSVLDTPVNWEFHSFKAYQTDKIPEPPKATPTPSETDKEYILNLSDKKYFDDSISTIKQEGSIDVSFFGTGGATRVYSDKPRTVSDAPIKVEQKKASEYKTTFKIPGERFVTNKNIVLDVRFKVSLEDYSAESPYIGLKLTHEGSCISEVNGMTWRGKQIVEADKDKMHTMRFIISPNGNEKNPQCAKTYYSYDGADYSIDENSNKDLTTIENYGSGNFRLWPVAIPQRDDFNVGEGDGVMEIPTTVNWEIHSMTAYQTDEIPPPASGWPEATPTPTPTAEPTATPDIGQSDRKEVVKTDDDSSNAGYFWDVTVDLSHKSFKGVFTSETDNKTLEKTFEIGNMQGGNAVFSVILLGAPADVKATFTIE